MPWNPCRSRGPDWHRRPDRRCPTPEVAECREIGRKRGYAQVVVIGVDLKKLEEEL